MISSSAMRIAWASGVPSRTSRTMRLARQRAGDFAVLVSAHAVGDQPQPELAVAVIGVFVQLAAQADVGEVSELDHASAMVRTGW